MKTTVGFLFILAIVSLVHSDPIWKVFCSGKPLFRGRLDPLVQPGVVGYHVHKVSGANRFSAGKANQSPLDVYNDITSSDCTTCSLRKVDNSQYWHPDLYYQWPNGTFSLVPDGGLTVYYLSRAGTGNQSNPDFKAFPPGFRMVAGNPSRRNFSGSIEDQAVSYACLAETPNKESNLFPTDHLFCKNGLRAQIFFPMCWNGKDLDSPDHKSHLAYPIEMYNNGNCPDTHPVRIPGLFFEAFYSVDKFPHGDGRQPFVWSCGDPTGAGFHADFLSGWDPKPFQEALKDPKCDSKNPDLAFGNNVKACPPLAPFVQNVPGDDECLLANKIPLTEDMGIGHTIPELPGCNPLTNKMTPPCEGPVSPSKVKGRFLIKSKKTLKYVGSNPPSLKNPMIANVSDPSLTEVWDPNPVIGGVCLLNEDSGKFASASGDGNVLIVDRGSVSTWETFKVINQTGGYVAILSLKNNFYVCVTDNGNLSPNSPSVTDDCLFIFEVPTGGNIGV